MIKTSLFYISVFLASILLIAWLAYIIVPLSLKPLDELARQKTDGKFIALSDGLTYYQTQGTPSPNKPTIIFVHGLTTPSFIFRGVIPILARAGYHVISYDLYGRGFSDRPSIIYDADLFDRQLAQLINGLSIQGDIMLVGYSLGGAIIAHFVAHHPKAEQISSLAFIAPAGLVVDQSGADLFLIPIFGDWLLTVFGRPYLLGIMAKPENQGRSVPDMIARYRQQLDYQGYFPALRSTVEHFPISTLKSEYQKIGRSSLPILAIWGQNDDVVPSKENIALMGKLMPKALFAVHPEASHAIPNSEPEFTAQSLLSFLRGETPKTLLK